MEQEIRFCKTSDGVRIAYATAGQGYPLLVVPGWLSHLELTWEDPQQGRLLKGLARQCRLIRYDKRGTGLSDRGVGDYSLEARLRDVDAVVESLGLEHFGLLGLSEGGPPAIEYAWANPDRVSHLILYCTFAKGRRSRTGEAILHMIQAQWGVLGTRTMIDLIVPDATAEDRDRIVQQQVKMATREDAAILMEAVFEFDVSDRLPEIQAPTLVLHAEDDRAILFSLGREIASSIPDARFVSFTGGHLPSDPATHDHIVELMLAHLPGAAGNEGSLGAVAAAVERSRPDLAPHAAEDGSVTLLFSDVEGFTPMTERLGDERAHAIIQQHNAIVRGQVAAHSGTELELQGDGFLLAFASPQRALRCAVAIQRGFAAYNEDHPDEPLRVRMGLHTGQAIRDADKFFGKTVIQASRIADRASGGEILASEDLVRLADGAELDFDAGHEVELKGLSGSYRLFGVQWAGRA